MRHASRLATLWATLFVAAAGPAAAAVPDFTGIWTLDLTASDPVDDLMKLQGLSFPERELASHMTVTQTIVQSASQLQIDVESVAKSRTEVLHLDGREETVATEQAGAVRTRTFWAPDGATLVTRSHVRLPDGKPAVLVVSRQLLDGGRTLAQRLELEVVGGGRYAATRVFRRA